LNVEASYLYLTIMGYQDQFDRAVYIQA